MANAQLRDSLEAPEGFDNEGFASAFFGGAPAPAPAGTPTLSTVTPTQSPQVRPPSGVGGNITDKLQTPQAQPYGGSDGWADLYGAVAGQAGQPGQDAAPATSPGTSMPPLQNGTVAPDWKGTGTVDTGKFGTPTFGGDKYQDILGQLKTSTDPTQQATLRDSLARSVATDLQSAGHQVKWDGDVVVVDGRRYTLGGSATGSADLAGALGGADPRSDPNLPSNGGGFVGPDILSGGLGGPAAPAAGGAWNTDGYATPQYTAGAFGNAPAGYDAGKWADPNHQTPKYVVGRLQAEAGGDKAKFAQLLAQAYPGATFNGKDKISGIPGIGTVDVYRGASVGENGIQWMVEGAGGGAGAPVPVNGGPDYAAHTPGTAGVAVNQPGGTSAIPGAQPRATAPDASMPWASAPTYQPGAIGMDDIPDLDMQGLLGQMGGYTPSDYEVGDISAGPIEGDTDALISSLLQNPESMDAKTVSQMQARNREEQADLYRQADEDLVGMGYESGIDGSRWLASERAGQRRGRDEAVMRGNRDIEVTAASTNKADRRAAGQLGAAYTESKGSGKRAGEALKLQASGQNQTNRFNAAKLQSDNVATAAKGALDAAAQRGDRLALRESVAQQATQLGLSKDKLMTDYVTAQMDDMTQRYGIDVEALLRKEGFGVDRQKIATSNSEFKEDLAFRIQQLGEEMGFKYKSLGQDRELGLTNVGLGYATLNQRKDENDTDAVMRGLGL